MRSIQVDPTFLVDLLLTATRQSDLPPASTQLLALESRIEHLFAPRAGVIASFDYPSARRTPLPSRGGCLWCYVRSCLYCVDLLPEAGLEPAYHAYKASVLPLNDSGGSGAGESRTRILLLAEQLLPQLSYSPIIFRLYHQIGHATAFAAYGSWRKPHRTWRSLLALALACSLR